MHDPTEGPPLNDAQREIIEHLGAPKSERPAFEPGLRDHLRTTIEKGLAPVVRELEDETLFLSKRALEQVHGCEARYLAEKDDDFAWSPPIARGIVAHKAIEISATSDQNWAPLDLVDEAIARLINSGTSIGDWLKFAAEPERDQVRTDANNAVCTFTECWPPLDRRWKPATEVPMRAEFFDGRIILSGKPDLTIGQSSGNVAGKVIVDFKTGRRSPAHRVDLQFYALLDTLRVGVPPRLLVSYYLEQGSMDYDPVNEAMIEAAAARVIGAATKIVELDTGAREPTYAPSVACRWCPALPTCDAGQMFMESRDDSIGDPTADDD